MGRSGTRWDGFAFLGPGSRFQRDGRDPPPLIRTIKTAARRTSRRGTGGNRHGKGS